jgi:cell division protein FtsX
MVGTVIYQGLMTYVRYAAFLYQTHEDSALKIIAVSGGIAALCLIVGLYLLTLDLVYLMTAPVAQQGRLGLHIYARDIWLIAMVVAGYAWHIRWLAEH